MGKRTFRKCRFYNPGDVFFTDTDMFKGHCNDTEIINTDINNIYLI